MTNRPHLHYFDPGEFFRGGIDWYARMDPRLLVLLDVFRHKWGAKVKVSPHEHAVGRFGGNSESQHNVARWGECRACDVMPEGMDTEQRGNEALKLAIEIGFNGAGIYPHWEPGPGLHLDTRRDRDPGNPALWGAVYNNVGAQVYVGVNQALGAFS